MFRKVQYPCTLVVVIGLSLYLAALKAQVSKGQALRPDYPILQIETKQSQGQVHFELYRLDKRHKPPSRIPVQIWQLTIFVPPGMPDNWIWRIYSKNWETKISTITYGVTPPMFVQEVPSDASPPRLEQNKEYFVSAHGEGGVGGGSFVYQGH